MQVRWWARAQALLPVWLLAWRLRAFLVAENFRYRSGQLIDAAFESAGRLAIGFYEGGHFLNSIEKRSLQL